MYEKSTFNKEKLSMRIISYGRKILVLSVQLSVFSVMGGGGQWPILVCMGGGRDSSQ